MGHCTTELSSDLQENQRHWALLKFEVLEMRGSMPATQNRKKKEQSKPGLWPFAHHRISVCSSAYIKKLQVYILNCVQGKQLETVSIKLWSTILFSNDMNLKKKKTFEGKNGPRMIWQHLSCKASSGHFSVQKGTWALFVSRLNIYSHGKLTPESCALLPCCYKLGFVFMKK